MSTCGCDTSPAPCACHGDARDRADAFARSYGSSIGAMFSSLAATLGANAGGARGAQHARNEIASRLGMPYVTADSRLVDPVHDRSGIAVGFGLELTRANPATTRSSAWRRLTVPIDRP